MSPNNWLLDLAQFQAVKGCYCTKYINISYYSSSPRGGGVSLLRPVAVLDLMTSSGQVFFSSSDPAAVPVTFFSSAHFQANSPET